MGRIDRMSIPVQGILFILKILLTKNAERGLFRQVPQNVFEFFDAPA